LTLTHHGQKISFTGSSLPIKIGTPRLAASKEANHGVSKKEGKRCAFANFKRETNSLLPCSRPSM